MVDHKQLKGASTFCMSVLQSLFQLLELHVHQSMLKLKFFSTSLTYIIYSIIMHSISFRQIWPTLHHIISTSFLLLLSPVFCDNAINATCPVLLEHSCSQSATLVLDIRLAVPQLVCSCWFACSGWFDSRWDQPATKCMHFFKYTVFQVKW